MLTEVLVAPEESQDSAAATTPSHKRWPRRLLIALAALVVLFYAAGGWMFSNEIRSGALETEPPGEPSYDIAVLAVDDGIVTLALTDTDNEHVDGVGVRGIEWPGGAARVGAVSASNADSVTRPFELYDGSGPLTAGISVDMHGYVLQSDPNALGLTYEEIAYPSPLGLMTALHFPAAGDDWAVLVHGKSAPVRETYRLVGPIVDAGMHALVINYRNDPGAPSDPSGFYRYGATEWQDLESAVAYAMSEGAEDVALIGYSMGGGIVMSFALESDLASVVTAIVLDAPMVDFGSTIDFRAEDRSLPLIGLPVPQSLTSSAKWIAGLRFDVDWAQLDYVDRSEALSIPVLAFHGTADESVPIGPIQRLAESRPDIVTLVEVPEAGHVLAWNVDPAAYEGRVVDFLLTHAGR